MASVADICNAALAHIGARAQISSIDPPDGTAEAGYCARFYPIARAELLASHMWSFNKVRALLAEVDNPSTVWSYAYAVPSDCFNATRILQKSDALRIYQRPWDTPLTADSLHLYSERGSSEFILESGILFTHEPEAVLIYGRDITDTAKFSPAFVVALSYLLASYLAGPILKGMEGAQLAGTMRQIATKMKESAASGDASNAAEAAEYIPESILRRA